MSFSSFRLFLHISCRERKLSSSEHYLKLDCAFSSVVNSFTSSSLTINDDYKLLWLKWEHFHFYCLTFPCSLLIRLSLPLAISSFFSSFPSVVIISNQFTRHCASFVSTSTLQMPSLFTILQVPSLSLSSIHQIVYTFSLRWQNSIRTIPI